LVVQVDLPDNLVLIGEAVASFNPVYGQGMTVSILEAMELEKCLLESRTTGHLSGLSQVMPFVMYSQKCLLYIPTYNSAATVDQFSPDYACCI
jgi:flavin-dependent dehydrogenase